MTAPEEDKQTGRHLREEQARRAARQPGRILTSEERNGRKMTTNNAVSLSDKVSELKTSIETIYTLLLSYGDDYVLPQNPETICFNMKARGDHYAYLFLAAEDYIAKARKQINELDRETEKLLEESQNQTA